MLLTVDGFPAGSPGDEGKFQKAVPVRGGRPKILFFQNRIVPRVPVQAVRNFAEIPGKSSHGASPPSLAQAVGNAGKIPCGAKSERFFRENDIRFSVL